MSRSFIASSLAVGVAIGAFTLFHGVPEASGAFHWDAPAVTSSTSAGAVPAIVATLAICIVFFPVVLLVGPARYLFMPLAMAVVFAMLASYLLSRTLVPTLARLHLRTARDSRFPRAA